MGNTVNSTEKRARRQNAVPSCLGCWNSSNEHDNFDSNELNIGLDFNKPRGKITPDSTAYLSNEEINFFKAAAGRNISLIRYYLNQGININILDEERTSPLHVAARHGSIQVVEELINSGANLNITDMAGWTRNIQILTTTPALHVAVSFQRSAVCELLLQANADSLIRNRDNLLPQDLVRDKMTSEIFKKYANQESKSKQSEDPENTFNFQKQQQQKNIAKQQFEQYFINLKKQKLIISKRPSEVQSYQPPMREMIRQATYSYEKDLLKNSSQGFTPQKPKEDKENKELSSQMDEQEMVSISKQKGGVGYTSKVVSEIPSDDTPERIRFYQNSPCQSQKSAAYNEDQISIQQLLYQPSFKSINLQVFESCDAGSRELGMEIFNHNVLLGIGYLILTQNVKCTSESIAKFLIQEDPSKSKVAVSEILSNSFLREQKFILMEYVRQVDFSSKDYLPNLKHFFSKLVLKNDPFQLDQLVQAVSAQIFHNNQKADPKKFPFKSTDAIHMFTFALVLLDIDINVNKIKDNHKKLECAVQDFILHIQGINNGDNFDQSFINGIIDEIRKNKIVNIQQNEQKDDLQKVRIKLNQLSQVGSVKLIKKKKDVVKQLEMFLIDQLIVMIGDNLKFQFMPKRLVRVVCENRRDLQMVPKLGCQCIIRASAQQGKMFKLKDHQKLNYMMANPAEYQKIESFNK